MKKICTLILSAALLLSLAACGGGEVASEPVDLNGVYETMQETLPEMMLMDETMMLNFCGIKAEDCQQVVAALSFDGLKTDEIWLIEAKNEAAMERLTALAETRVKAKADETVSYSPEQYAVVEKAQIVTEGMYLALLVSPDVDTLKAVFEEAVK